MKLRYFLSVSLFAVLLAGCGGGGGAGSLSSGDIAVVSGQHITKAQFDEIMTEQKFAAKAQGKSFPKAGSTDYASLKAQVLQVLLQDAEFEAEAQKLGVKVTDAQVQAKIDQVKKQYFENSQSKYEQGIKAQGFTDAAVREQFRSQLLANALFNKVTSNVTPTDKEVQSYYNAHKSQYVTKASRAVRYILVGKNKATLAQSLRSQLTGASDATWCADAKKYSQDPSTKNSCGKSTFQQGQTVAEFNKLLFSLKTGTVGATNSSQYGWFVVEPTAAAKPGGTQSEASVDSTIRATVQQQDRNQQMTDWVTNITKGFCNGGKIKYQAGYAPSPDPCASLATATNTSTTG